jgi:hypothetical protein
MQLQLAALAVLTHIAVSSARGGMRTNIPTVARCLLAVRAGLSVLHAGLTVDDPGVYLAAPLTLS